jgi:hypothetical protein
MPCRAWIKQTRLMETHRDLVKKVPRFEVQPFNVASVAKLPIVLVRTFRPVTAEPGANYRSSSRICPAPA